MFPCIVYAPSYDSTIYYNPTVLATYHSVPSTNVTDHLALLKFKESIDYDPHGILSFWNDSIQFCNWHGITCGRRHQRVIALELEAHTLRGTISPFIGNLTFLRAIHLQNNSFYGEIPKEVGHLFRLRDLNLLNNTLGREIPTSLSNYSELRLMSLISLQVAKNYFIRGIPGFLGDLSFLENFLAAYNELEGNIPESVGRLKSLSYFAVGTNKLNGMVPPSLYNISSIQILAFTLNQLSGTLLENIGHTLPNLQQFLLSDNKFFGSIPSSSCNASKLQILDLSNNSFVGSVPTYLGYLQDLRKLHLSKNNLGRDLDFLNIYIKTNFEGVLPSSIGNLSTQLIELYLGGNKISGTFNVALQNLINLIVLGNFSQMQVLSFSRNKLLGKIPSSIGNLTQLVVLFLFQNNLEESIPPSIGTCQSFQIFSLSLLLNLSHNSFSGKLPVEVDGLKNIDSLDVSKNNFFGEIPITIGNCFNLVYLGLQGNYFNGNIPSSMASLKGLEHLDVSRNSLSGLIPKGLEKLSFLNYLNISFNNIEGEVPIGGVFRNVNMITVIGNNKLCGGNPQLKLPTCPKVTKSRKKRSNKKPLSTVSNIDLLLTISYKMLHQATNGFSPNNLIGSGSFGLVYKGVLEQHERLVAVKVLNLQMKGAPKSFMAKCNILSCCSTLAFEFMTNGSLDMWLHPMIDSEYQSQNLSFIQRLIIAIDVASALCYLHNHCEQKIIHCDLKPSNIFLNNEMIAHHTSTIELKGSIGYTAPEYGVGGEASTEGDVYSYGVLVLEMFIGRRPTNDMFRDGLNLHNFVKMALPKRLAQIVDPLLLSREATEMGVAAATIMAKEKADNNDDNANEIEVEEADNNEESKQIDADMQKFLLSIFNIGILCSMESPKERMSMEEVLKELQLIKNIFVGLGNLKGRPSRSQVKGI
ncbi:hypothetical protein ACB092_11G025800 [Castanea dentata]